MNLKQSKKNRKIKFIIWFFIALIFFTLLLFHFITRQLNPLLEKYSSLETKRFATFLINHAVNEVVVKDVDHIYITSKNSDGEIQTIDFDTAKVNKLLEDISNRVQKVLLQVEDGNMEGLHLSKSYLGERYGNVKKGVVFEIPVGSLFNSALFSNFGPRIPIRWTFVGHVTTNLNTKVKEYGLNNVYLEVKVHVEVTERVLLPFSSKEETISLDVPLGIKVIQGRIPNYYNGTFDENSKAFTLPMMK